MIHSHYDFILPFGVSPNFGQSHFRVSIAMDEKPNSWMVYPIDGPCWYFLGTLPRPGGLVTSSQGRIQCYSNAFLSRNGLKMCHLNDAILYYILAKTKAFGCVRPLLAFCCQSPGPSKFSAPPRSAWSDSWLDTNSGCKRQHSCGRSWSSVPWGVPCPIVTQWLVTSELNLLDPVWYENALGIFLVITVACWVSNLWAGPHRLWVFFVSAGSPQRITAL